MKNTFKITMLFCLVACMLFSTVACNVVIAPAETGTTDEVTGDGTTPEGTTPNYPEAPVPVESVGFQVVSETEDSYSFRVFIDSTEENAYIDLKPFFNAVLVPAKFPELGFDSVIETFEFLVDDKLADANTKVFNGSIVTFRVKTTLNYPEAPVPVESVGFQVISETEDSYSFRVSIDSTEENAYIDLKPFFDGVLVPAMFPGFNFDFMFATVEFLVDDKPADANTKVFNGSIVTFRAKTTPEETTPEETTPEETTPEEITPPDPNEGKSVYQVKVTDENQQPLAGVELQICYGAERISLPATAANGYTVSEFVEIKNYTVRVIRADGYQFDPNFDYPLITGTNVAYIVLAPVVVDNGPGMPEKVDLDGYTYRAYVRSNVSTGDPWADGNPSFYCEDFWLDPNMGEPEDALSYAVYYRNREIEYDYNVHIRQIQQSRNMTEELNIFYQNGERIDLTIILAKSAASAATQNLLADLNSLSDLNLEHEAYDQNSIRELQMGGKLYYLSGDMNISTLDSVATTVVNLDMYEMFTEDIVDNFDSNPLYADIYEVVRAGKWTIGTMLKIAELVSCDVDTTDGALGANPSDTVGYYQYNQSAIYYFYGAGGRITQINEDASPELVIQESKNQEVFDYLFDNLHPITRNINYPNGFSGDRKRNFITNANTLFTEMTLWDVRKDLYVNCTFNYGLLPTPTYQEGEDYNSVVYFYNTVHLWAIPNFVENTDTAQLMFDVMAAYSNLNKEGSTMDAYYTRTLNFTIAPDPNAREVMNIIKNSTVYDIALLYDWGGWATELSELWYRRSTNNYGTLVTLLPTAQEQLEDTIEQFKNPSYVEY